MNSLGTERGTRRRVAISAIGIMMALAIFLNAEMTQAASCSHDPIRNSITLNYYKVIQTAYNAAAIGQPIQIQTGYFTENLTLSNPLPVKLSGGYSCDYSSNTGFATIFGNVTITGGTVTADDLIISTAVSQPPAPAEPWPLISPSPVYISGTTCPVASTLECSQQISNGPSCLYQSCTCYFSQSGVGDTDSGYWKTFDAAGHLTGIFDCETNGGLTALQIREGSCSIMFNPQVEAFIDSCVTCNYSYSDWSECQPNNTQTRTVISLPTGCVGTPVLSQSCTYVPPPSLSVTIGSASCDANDTGTISGTACGPVGAYFVTWMSGGEITLSCVTWDGGGYSDACTRGASEGACMNWTISDIWFTHGVQDGTIYIYQSINGGDSVGTPWSVNCP